MKLNTRFLLATCICGAFALFSQVTRAQDANPTTPVAGQVTPREGQDRGEALEKLAKALDLTDEQKSQIKSIVEQRRARIMQLRDNKSIPPEQKKDQIREILQTSMEQIKAVLTPGQQQKLEQIMERVKEHREEQQK